MQKLPVHFNSFHVPRQIYGFLQATKPDPCKTEECALYQLAVGCVTPCPAGMGVVSSCVSCAQFPNTYQCPQE